MPTLALAQDTKPADDMSGMQMAQPQTKQPPTSPAACVEDMPGMQMCPKPASPTDKGATQKSEMAGMSMDPGMMELMENMHPQTFLQQIQHHASAGTSAEPNSTPTPMLMTMKGSWMLMFHSNVFVTDIQQTSPRGDDKLFSTNWLMPMLERRWGPGQLTLQAMFSLEPATITGRQYPLLFQQGRPLSANRSPTASIPTISSWKWRRFMTSS